MASLDRGPALAEVVVVIDGPSVGRCFSCHDDPLQLSMRRIADDLLSAVEASISRPALLGASMHATRRGALGDQDAGRSRLNPLAREVSSQYEVLFPK